MSELINARSNGRDFRWQLLTTVSALTLLAAVYGSNETQAAEQDADHPTVWIELGGQFEQVSTDQEAFVPPFSTIQPVSGPNRQGVVQIAPGSVQKPLGYSYGADGNISFQPEGTDWVFSADVRYGRSNGSTHVHRSTKPVPTKLVFYPGGNVHYFSHHYPEFADAASKRSESHIIVDFQVGNDVGLGMFGKDSRSTFGFGVRFAQFHSALQAILGLGPDNGGYAYLGPFKLPTQDTHTFLGEIRSTRSFHGLGPSVSWNGSAPFAGSADRAEFTIDWGANAAVLFGRQRASIHHQTTGRTHPSRAGGTNPYQLTHTLYQHSMDHARSRAVTVPNVGGFAGLSLKFLNAKVSFGYRADFFFGAIDGGIDMAKKEDRGFYGPFASVSVGIGG
jgi:hypothetical protein